VYFWNKQKENIIWFSFVADYNYFLFFLFGYSILFACLRMKKRKYKTVLWNLKKNVRKRLKRTRVEKKKSNFSFSFINRQTSECHRRMKKKKKRKRKLCWKKECVHEKSYCPILRPFFSRFAFFRWQTIIKKTHQHLHLIHTSVEVDVSYTFFNSLYFTIIIIFIISSSSICILSIDIFIRFQSFVWSSYTKRTTNTTNKDWIERKQWQKTEWRYCTHRVVKKIKRLFFLSLSPFLSFSNWMLVRHQSNNNICFLS